MANPSGFSSAKPNITKRLKTVGSGWKSLPLQQMEQLADFPQTERSEQTSNHDGALAAYRLHWRIGTAHIVRINAYVAGAHSSLSHGSRELSP
jgi:hypothetical protein